MILNTTITTSRLTMLPLTESTSDTDFCVELYTNPEVMKYLWEPEPEELIRYAMSQMTLRGADGALGMWSINDTASKEQYGVGLILPLPIEEPNTNWHLLDDKSSIEGDIEVGYILKPDAWGKGIATETAKSLLEFAFENIDTDKLVAVIEDENQASRTVLEKLGMTEQGLKMSYGQMSPWFEIQRSEWMQNSKQ